MRLKREKFYHYARVKIQYFTFTQNRIFFFFFKKYATWRCMKSTKEKLWKKWMKLPHAVISWLVKKQVHQKFTYKQSIINLILLKIISTDPPKKNFQLSPEDLIQFIFNWKHSLAYSSKTFFLRTTNNCLNLDFSDITDWQCNIRYISYLEIIYTKKLFSYSSPHFSNTISL